MIAVRSMADGRPDEGNGEMGVLSSSATASHRARFDAISAEIDGCAGPVATGVRR
jgi:hypothetical protein